MIECVPYYVACKKKIELIELHVRKKKNPQKKNASVWKKYDFFFICDVIFNVYLNQQESRYSANIRILIYRIYLFIYSIYTNTSLLESLPFCRAECYTCLEDVINTKSRSFFFLLLKDEKNQLLVTNTWLKLVSQ